MFPLIFAVNVRCNLLVRNKNFSNLFVRANKKEPKISFLENLN